MSQRISFIPSFGNILFEAIRIDGTGLHREDKTSIVKKALDDLSSVFETNISLMILDMEKDAFFSICEKVYDKYKIPGENSICISSEDSIPQLARNKWKLLVASDKNLP